MSKTMPTYQPAEFHLPKVQGLAVHNAKKATEREMEYMEPWGKGNGTRLTCNIPWEVYAYCFFGVRNDCSVFPIAFGTTADDMAPIIKSANLRALADKYRLIGFVHAKTPKRAKQYETIEVPKGGRK